MKSSVINKFYTLIVLIFFSMHAIIMPSGVIAQEVIGLPAPGTLVPKSANYTPAIFAGMTLYPDNPLQFDFIIDVGDDKFTGNPLRKEAQKLINYFMATLTIPEDEMWVNLSPYEKNRIIADGLGNTMLGRDMLAQDYILKQLTASLLYPEDELGKEFWQRVYQKAEAKFGTTEIPTNTFNKIWIVPHKATIYINGTNVFIEDSYLKVMLEEDYVALKHHDKGLDAHVAKDDFTTETKAILREIVLPEIEREVNEGKNFANLRQIYHSMILATWYKNNLKESLLGQVYVDRNKIDGVDVSDKQIKLKIYNQYIQAFKKGVYDYIKEDFDPATQQVIPRQYFSGGEDFAQLSEEVISNTATVLPDSFLSRRSDQNMVRVTAQSQLNPHGGSDAAMLGKARSYIPGTLPWARKVLDENYDYGEKSIIKALKRIGRIKNKTETDLNRLYAYLDTYDDARIQLIEKFLSQEQKLNGYLQQLSLRGDRKMEDAVRGVGGSTVKIVDAYIHALTENKNTYNRRAVIKRLGELGDVRAISVLIKLVVNEDNYDLITLGEIGLTLEKLGDSRLQDVYHKLISNQNVEAYHRLNLLKEAIPIRLSGYDFNVITTAPRKHQVVRGEKLEELAHKPFTKQLANRSDTDTQAILLDYLALTADRLAEEALRAVGMPDEIIVDAYIEAATQSKGIQTRYAALARLGELQVPRGMTALIKSVMLDIPHLEIDEDIKIDIIVTTAALLARLGDVRLQNADDLLAATLPLEKITPERFREAAWIRLAGYDFEILYTPEVFHFKSIPEKREKRDIMKEVGTEWGPVEMATTYGSGETPNIEIVNAPIGPLLEKVGEEWVVTSPARKEKIVDSPEVIQILQGDKIENDPYQPISKHELTHEQFENSSKEDKAVLVTDTSGSPEYGGIDFNANHLKMEFNGRPMQINVPASYQEIQPSQVEGVTTTIINIVPIANFPFLLGLGKESEQSILSRLN